MRKVKDIILGQVLEIVAPHNLIIDALRRMEAKMISSLLVFEGNEFRGIITMTDIATAMYGQSGGLVENIMTPVEKVKSVSLEDGLRKCIQLIREYKFHHLVVKDTDGKVVGVISSIDLMKAEDDGREDAAEAARNMPPS